MLALAALAGSKAGTYRRLRRHAYERVGGAAERPVLWVLITYLACLAVILNDVARALDEPRRAD
jgi:hypothetical protein